MAEVNRAALCMVLIASSVQAHGPPPGTTAFECSAGQKFEVEYHDRGRIAVVRTRTRDFQLPKRAASLGMRFSSDEATLIIDGDLAAFVADGVNEYLKCRAATHPLPTDAGSSLPPEGD